MYIPGEIIKRENGKVYLRVGQGNMILILNENEIEETKGGVNLPDSLAETNPWLKLADKIKDKQYFMSRDTPEGTELVVPVANVGEDTFLGYRAIVNKNGEIVKVLDAGKYRRFMVPGLEKYTLLLPVEKISDITNVSREEFGMLADGTPAEILPKIYAYDKELAGALTAEKLRRDPLSLTSIPENELKKLLEVARDYWMLASPESNPPTIEMLIEELRGIAPNVTPELDYLKERLYEEKYEEKQLERMKKEEEKRYEEWERRIREEEARKRAQQTIKDVKEIIKAVTGVVIPIVIAKTPAVAGIKKSIEIAEKAQEAIEERERESVTE
jgi:hypothetical protein